MKILITTPIFPPEIGGPATYTVQVSKQLKERGHQVRVIAFTDLKPQVEEFEVIPIRLSYKVLGTVVRQVRLFPTILGAAKGMELIYAQGPVVVGLTSLIAGKLMRKPVVVKFVGDIAWENAFNLGRTSRFLEEFLSQPQGGLYTALIMRIQRFVFHNADKIITPSHFLKDLLIKYYEVPPPKIDVVYNAVKLDESEATVERRGWPVVITVGRLVPSKGIAELIELVPALAEKYPDFRLVVVGDGPEKEKLKMLGKKMGIEPHVIFTGNVSHEETLASLKSSDVFVLNSRYEGLPHSVIEAMACQCPVIATNIKGTREVVDDGRTGIAVEPGNKRQLEEKIIYLLENESARSKMVKQAYQNVKSKFIWESTISKLEETLSGTLG